MYAIARALKRSYTIQLHTRDLRVFRHEPTYNIIDNQVIYIVLARAVYF